jgi:putative DNA primase/helicase
MMTADEPAPEWDHLAGATPPDELEPGPGQPPRPVPWRPWQTWDAANGSPGPLHGPRRDRPDGSKVIPWPVGATPDRLIYFATPDHCPPAAGSPLILAEGEKTAGAIAEAGYLAAGTVGSKASTHPAVYQLLAKYDLTIAPDNDEPGRAQMAAVARELELLGAPRLRIIQPPEDAPKGWDLADVDVDERRRLIGEARELLGFGLVEPAAEPSEAPAHLVKQSRAAWHFAQMAGDRVRFDHGRGRWLVWSGHRWQPDEDGSIERLWLAVLADRYRLALAADDRERQRLLAEVQTAGATNSAVSAGLELAASFEPIATRADAWDPDPMLLGCENGVVDLRTGDLRAGRPEDMISRSTLIAYSPGADCPRWQRFLREVFAGDDELVEWFARLIGSSLVGRSKELLPVHHGRGNNGKSVAIRTLRRAFGEYAVVVAVETLVNAKREAGAATPDLMVLRGARIAFATEPDKTARLRGGTLKRLVSIDQMTGRGLYGAPSSWEPTHALHLATNHLPAADDATEGFWRRIALVPWAVRFAKPGEDGLPEDVNLAETLAGEAPGILAWAVRGAVAYAGGRSLWPFPAAVRAKTDGYRADEDKLGAFVAARVIYDSGAAVALNALFAAYETWCIEEDVPLPERFKRRAFGAYFEDRGRVERFKDSADRVAFKGARLASSGGSAFATQFPDFPTRVGDIEKSANDPLNAEEPISLPLAPVESDTVACSDASGHSTSIRRAGSGWVCDICQVTP